MRQDRGWPSLIRNFAAEKELVEKEVKWGPEIAAPDTEINWEWIKKGFSRNPAITGPVPGTLFESEDGEFAMDEVRVRRALTSTHDCFLRLSVKITEVPPTLSIRPAGIVRRFLNRLGRNSTAPFPENLSCILSSKPTDRARELSFLTRRRCRILEDAQSQLGGVYMHGGRLYLIRNRSGRDSIHLNGLYDDLTALAKRLSESNSNS
jgi:hypothetical protein